MLAKKITSTNIFSIAYEPGAMVLAITFSNNGAIYLYGRVPQEVYTKFCKAESAGKFLHANLKDVYGTFTEDDIPKGTVYHKFLAKVRKINKVYEKAD